jgi:HEAT repeat protein
MLLIVLAAGCTSGTETESQAAEDTPALVEALQSEDPAERADAAEALGARGDSEAVPALIDLLEDEDEFVRLAAVEALGQIGDQRAVEPLSKVVAGSSPTAGADEREAAAVILGELGDPVAVEALVQYSTESYETVKEALLAIGKPAVEPLIEALKLKSEKRREVAADALGAIGDARAVEPLIAYGNRSYAASLVASAALAEIGKPAVKPLTAALNQAVKSGDRDAAEMALLPLGEIGDLRAAPAVTAAMQSDLPPVAWQAASDTLAKLYRKDVPTLLAMLKSPDTVRIYWGLIGLGRAGTVDELIAALDAYGGEEMAEDYLNSGNEKLEDVGRAWAEARGYTITEIPGFDGQPWGTKSG